MVVEDIPTEVSILQENLNYSPSATHRLTNASPNSSPTSMLQVPPSHWHRPVFDMFFCDDLAGHHITKCPLGRTGGV